MITEQFFKSELKKLGLANYRVAGNDIVISSTETLRAKRKSLLESIQSAFLKDSEYVKDKGAGFLRIKLSSKTIKVFVKPEKTSSGILLKPNFFAGMTDVDIPFIDYGNKLLNSIESNINLVQEQKELLKSLVNYHMTFSSTDLNKLKSTFISFKDTIPTSTINNDFGELLGPLAIIKKNLIKEIPSIGVSVFVPFKGNFPLLDYKLIVNGNKNTVFKISAKSGDTTNTLKPGDVISLIEEEPKLLKKYKDSTQFNIVKILNENSVKLGPIEAIKFLKTKNFEKAKFISASSEYTEQLRQQCEKLLVSISKEDLDFTNMFNDATNAKIHYIKFKLGSDGTPIWSYIEPQKNRPKLGGKRIAFRSKNTIGRAADKLGFQPV